MFTLYLAMRTITRSGSLAIVKMNIANGGPKAMKLQPKNSIIVILASEVMRLQQQQKKCQVTCEKTIIVTF